MIPFCAWLEQTGYSVWVRESPSLLAFPFMLILHAIGMGLVAGLHTSMCLRVLGVSPAIPLPAMRSFFPALWLGVAINVFSGVSLLIAYPAKALTNPLFYLKLALLAVAFSGFLWMRKHVFADKLPARARQVAFWSIFCWGSAIIAGRWLAYTYSILMSGDRV
jgi:hypothetical protein